MLSNIKKIIKNMILSKEELDYLNYSSEKEKAQLLINLDKEQKEFA